METVFANGSKETYTYDAVGNMSSAINDTAAEYFYYDELSRLVKAETVGLTGEATQTVKFTYNKVGDPLSISTLEPNGNERKVEYTYDELNRLSDVVFPDKGQVAFTYDPLNRVLEKINSNGTKTTYTYTPRGEIESIVNYEDKHHGFDKVLSSFGYLYNGRGQRIYQVQEDGRITAYQYDPVGRIKGAYYPFQDKKKISDLKERFEYGLLPGGKNPKHYKFDFKNTYNWEEKDNFQKQITEFLDNLSVQEVAFFTDNHSVYYQNPDCYNTWLPEVGNQQPDTYALKECS